MLKTTIEIEVRYPECDRMGIVHHAVYPIWYEMARMDFFEKMGCSFEQQNAMGIDPMMVDLHLQYKAPATYPQKLKIVTHLSMFAPKKLELCYECFAEGRDEPINTCKSFHIWAKDMKSVNVEEVMPKLYEKIKHAAE